MLVTCSQIAADTLTAYPPAPTTILSHLCPSQLLLLGTAPPPCNHKVIRKYTVIYTEWNHTGRCSSDTLHFPKSSSLLPLFSQGCYISRLNICTHNTIQHTKMFYFSNFWQPLMEVIINHFCQGTESDSVIYQCT